jgi:hypothetical protein
LRIKNRQESKNYVKTKLRWLVTSMVGKLRSFNDFRMIFDEFQFAGLLFFVCDERGAGVGSRSDVEKLRKLVKGSVEKVVLKIFERVVSKG